MDKNLISIIVPLYFGARYIKNILDMVEKNHDFLCKEKSNLDIEVIFVNDSCEKIAFADRKFAIHLLNNKKNCGVHYSRIQGVKISKGKFLTFWDQDDWFSQEYLYRQVHSIQNADVSICNGYYREKRLIFSDMPQLDRQWILENSNLIRSPGQALIRKNAIPQKWIDNIICNSGADDMFLWSVMAIDNRRFSYNEQLLYTHVEDGNNTSFNWEKQAQSVREMIERMGTDYRFQGDEYKRWIDKWENTEKKFRQYDYLDQMMNSLMNNKTDKNKIRNIYQGEIAIYGFGVVGKNFLRLLDHYGIECKYAIDKIMDEDSKAKIKIFHYQDKYPEVETVIVTPIFQFEEIKAMLQKKLTNTAIVSLDFVLKEMMRNLEVVD